MNDVVGKVTGNFGIWQLRAVLIIFLCKIPSSWFMACVIFTAPEPRDGEVYCKPPENLTNYDSSIWINLAHPIVNNQTEENTTDYCNVFENAEQRAKNYFNYIYEYDRKARIPVENINNIKECSEFQHEAKYYSLVMQFDLVCSREILVAWTQFFHLFGVLLGGIIATRLMDYFSPRRVMLIGMTSQIVSGCLCGVINNFVLHCFFRCTSAIFCALMFTAGTVIFSEITGGKYRLAVCTLFDQFWSIGVILLPGLSNLFQSWVHIYLAISLPTFVLIFLYRWIPDAPLWLLKHGRVKEVEAILLESAEVNDRHYFMPADLEHELEVQSEILKTADPPPGWWDLWTGPNAKRHFIAAHIAWAVYVVNFNGMLLNIRSFGREYLEINTIFTGFSEIIGCFLALFLVLNTKRKWMWAGIYNIVAGLIGCLGWLFPHKMNEILRVALWMVISSIPKAGVSISQSMLMACSGELVPPKKRPIFIFSCLVWARIWLLTAPFINVLKYIDTAFSLSFFTILGLIGGIATCCFKAEPPKEFPTWTRNGVINLALVEDISAAGSNSRNIQKTKL